MQVALAATLDRRNTFTFHPEYCARLRAFSNLQLVLTFKRRDGDLRAQSRLAERDRHRAEQVFAFTLKESMRLHMQDYVQITRSTATRSKIALLLVTDARSIFHARRHRDRNGAFAHHPRLAFALGARIGNDSS